MKTLLLFLLSFICSSSFLYAQTNVGLPASNIGAITSGVNNTALGNEAGSSLTSGSRNVHIGNAAAKGATAATRNDNVVIGDSAAFNLDAHRNVVIGSKAGLLRNEGNDNVMIGYEAGWNNDKGKGNVYIGSGSGKDTNDGSDNVFIGNESGMSNDNGDNNIFIGKEAGKDSDDGSNNVFIGKSAGEVNDDGTNNTFIGYRSGIASVNASKNVAIGDSAAVNFTGTQSVAIGSLAGTTTLSGSNNVFIGANSRAVGASAATLSNVTAIGNNAMVGVEDAIVLGDTTNTDLKIGIGTASPRYRLDVKGVVNMQAANNSPSLKINDYDFINIDNYGRIALNEFRLKYKDASKWSDHVFTSSHELLSINDLEKFIYRNGHLPNIPTAEDVEKEGVSMSEITSKLLEKVEEQALYIIQLQKQIDELRTLIVKN